MFNRFTTLSEAVEQAPAYFSYLRSEHCSENKGSDDHVTYFLWGPDEADTMRLYFISSRANFTVTELSHGTHTIPRMTNTQLPEKLSAPSRQLASIVKVLHRYIAQRDGPGFTGGDLVFLSQRPKHLEFQALDDKLPERPEPLPVDVDGEEADAPEADAPKTGWSEAPIWASFAEYRRFLTDAYITRHQRLFPNLSRADRRRFAKEAEKLAAAERDAFDKVSQTAIDQQIHARQISEWVEQAGAPTQ